MFGTSLRSPSFFLSNGSEQYSRMWKSGRSNAKKQLWVWILQIVSELLKLQKVRKMDEAFKVKKKNKWSTLLIYNESARILFSCKVSQMNQTPAVSLDFRSGYHSQADCFSVFCNSRRQQQIILSVLVIKGKKKKKEKRTARSEK